MTILAPALGSALLAFGGLQTVLIVDLITFAVAFTTLLLFISIPEARQQAGTTKETFFKSCAAGINFLRAHSALLRIILFFAFINFIAKMGSYGMLPALILGKTGGNQVALGGVETAVGIGTLVGSVFVILLRPAKNRTGIVFFACGISFLLGDVGHSISPTLPFWVATAFVSNVPMAFLNANLTAIMRSNVPIEMQGRVFSARDTIQYSTIPIGLYLGGVLADYIFEPFMVVDSPMQKILSMLFGTGKGAGIAVMFFIVGIVGCITSFFCLKNPVYRTLNNN